MDEFLYNIKLRYLVVARKGIKPQLLKSTPFENSIPYLDVVALESNQAKEYTFKELALTSSDGDILVVWDGSRSGYPFKGKFGAIGSTLMQLTPVQLDHEYLYYFLKLNYDFVNRNSSGTGIPHVDADIFFDLSVPFIPLAGQKEIVADLNSKMVEFNLLKQKQNEIAKAALALNNSTTIDSLNIKSSLQHFRTAILDRAFKGELTATWRKGNKLQKVWVETTLDDVSKLITSGSRDWKQYYSRTGARFIRTQDIKDNRIDKSKMIFVDLPVRIEGKRTFVESGDVLLTIVGSNIGKCAVIDDSFAEEGYVNQAIALIKPKATILSSFMSLFFQSSFGQKQIQAKVYGDAQPDLNLKDIRNFKISLPSLDEQSEIVNIVSQMFELTDKIMENYERDLLAIEMLEKSLLKETFEQLHKKKESDGSLSITLEWLERQRKEIEHQRKLDNINNRKMRNSMLDDLRKTKSLLEILKDSDGISTEDLWANSMYFEKKDVEGFYIELSQLKKQKAISTKFMDNNNVSTIVHLTEK